MKSTKRRRPAASNLPAATTMMRVAQHDGEVVDLRYAGHRTACQAFATAMDAGNIESAEMWTLDDEGEPGTRFARYANDGV